MFPCLHMYTLKSSSVLLVQRMWEQKSLQRFVSPLTWKTKLAQGNLNVPLWCHDVRGSYLRACKTSPTCLAITLPPTIMWFCFWWCRWSRCHRFESDISTALLSATKTSTNTDVYLLYECTRGLKTTVVPFLSLEASCWQQLLWMCLFVPTTLPWTVSTRAARKKSSTYILKYPSKKCCCNQGGNILAVASSCKGDRFWVMWVLLNARHVCSGVTLILNSPPVNN